MAKEILKEQKQRAERWKRTAIVLLVILCLIILGLVGVVTGKFSNYVVIEKSSQTVTVQAVKVKGNG